jgi:aminoglycoside phosphotransferase (APT) family kinase protein
VGDRKMHTDEVAIGAGLVRRLLAQQFPRWAELPIEPVRSDGTDNAIYRLGRELAVRLPRMPAATKQVHKEQRWLPELAPRLPLAIPAPVAMGSPAEGYPWRWSVYRWLEGEDSSRAPLADLPEAAEALARFVSAFHGIDLEGGPAPGQHNFFRGVPLAAREAMVGRALDACTGLLDVAAARRVWETALVAALHVGRPRWIHGDLKADNLLTVGGRLSGVIDFGGLGVGDPACDLIIAWDLFSGESRDAFRSSLDADDAAWERGRGWALSVAVTALPYYLKTNPGMVRYACRLLDNLNVEQRAAD